MWLTILNFTTLLVTAQNFVGDWYGNLDAGIQKFRIVFHIKKDSAGKYNTTSDSPDQKAFGVPIQITKISGDSLLLKVPRGNMEYKGKLVGDSIITGNFIQGITLPLTLSRRAFDLAAPKRSQTPLPPFNYKSEDVIYYNKDSSIKYGATITYPNSGSNFPAIVLITGSGPQDRDENLFEHKPFLVIADHLSKQGYAVLRIDDRGVGKTTGNFYTTGTKEYVEDANAAINFLQKRKNINLQKIGLMGHSLGGMIAPMVAAQNKDVAFIISLAGVGITGKELLQKQRHTLRNKNEIQNSSDSIIMNDFHNALDSLAANKKDAPGFISAAKMLIKNTEVKIKDSLTKAGFKEMQQYLEMGYIQRNSAEYKSIITYNPALYFKNLKIPFLAINGDKDVQVDADMNLKGFETLLTKAGNKNFKVVKLEGLNHLFQKCNTCDVSEYSTLEETFSTRALKVIEDWLTKNVSNK